MIDTNDTQTQPLALDEQPAKAKRGRPATGKALSNAERQRAYRKRQKAQRNENPVAAKVEFELGEKARQRVRELEKELALKETQLAYWIKRAEEAEEAARISPEKRWVMESKAQGTRKWYRMADNKYTQEEAIKLIEAARKRFPDRDYRVKEI
ncbi:hypothetical protein D9M70_411100 [compost metagenome]